MATAVLIASSQTAQPAVAASSLVKINSLKATLFATQKVTVKGSVSRSLRGKSVKLEYFNGTGWQKLKSVKASKKGKWSATIRVPSGIAELKVRAQARGKKSKVRKTTVLVGAPITTAGPGGRILGADISRWQHTVGHDIDFPKMAASGMAFVILKASDGDDTEDQKAQAFAQLDAQAARAAGIILGYYHLARILPNADPKLSNNPDLIVASATAQATRAANRLVELGGYDGRTLPYVLDIERIDSSITDASVTLWTKTWYTQMLTMTGRKPMIYSYRSFFQDRYLTNADTVAMLKNMRLWLAQPADPADPNVVVGQKVGDNTKCYKSAWSTLNNGCGYQWTLWQYTSLGDRELFGIPWKPAPGTSCPADSVYCIPGAGSGTGRKHLDLNVFNGSVGDLNALISGS